MISNALEQPHGSAIRSTHQWSQKARSVTRVRWIGTAVKRLRRVTMLVSVVSVPVERYYRCIIISSSFRENTLTVAHES